MDPKLYKVIQTDSNLNFLQPYTNQLETQLTPNKNTTLHIAALFGSTKSAKEILKTSPSLVLCVNNKGQTPLHIAAVEGHYKIAHMLIEHARAVTEELESGISASKHMVRMRNEDGDTALHEAVRYKHLHVVKLLLEEDSEFFYLPNKAEETPLYKAAEEGLDQFVYEILETCASPSYSGPAGRTALHAAVIFDYQEILEKLLNWKQVLSKDADLCGWTPLHYAARLGNFLHPRAKKMAFNKQGMTPLDVYREKTVDYGVLKMAFKMHGAIGQRNLISKDKDEIATKEKFRAEWGEGAVEKLKKLADTNLIVATLIATVSFAAGFTLPGGYDGNAGPNHGNAVLSRRAAFKAFVIADTVAMMCSSCAVFIYFMVAGMKHRRTLVGHQSFANSLVLYAEAAMMIAFVTGLYVTLVANSFRLAVTVCAIGCFFFLIYFIELKAFCNHYRSLLHW